MGEGNSLPHRLEDEPRSMAGKEWEEAALPPRKNESETGGTIVPPYPAPIENERRTGGALAPPRSALYLPFAIPHPSGAMGTSP